MEKYLISTFKAISMMSNNFYPCLFSRLSHVALIGQKRYLVSLAQDSRYNWDKVAFNIKNKITSITKKFNGSYIHNMATNGIVENVIIVGSGPAAHTAAIYAARAELKPLLFEGFFAGGVAAGGQLTTTTDVENFPGFPEGIGGLEITEKFRAQSQRFGARILTETIESVNLSSIPFQASTLSRTYLAKSIIIATGATARRLDIQGAGEGPGQYWQRGVSACAVCDGAAPIFRNMNLVVVGGGDSAMEEATFLTKFARRVYIVHRRDQLRASKIMQKRALANSKIEILYSHVVSKVLGDENKMTHVTVKDLKTDRKRTFDAAGLFFAIGHKPNTDFLKGQLKMDDDGYIITTPGSTATSRMGVFACGDCQDKKWRQAITAAGTGCMAAIEVEHYLTSLSD